MRPIERFLDQAARLPGQIAIHTVERDWRYAELAHEVACIAGYLRSSGQTRVAIALPQGPQAYAAMLGCLMAGCFYAPLNLAGAAERMASILRAFEPELILAEERFFTQHNAGLEGLSAQQADIADARAAPALAAPCPPHELAYVIFTSGSTGTPKGVMISTRAMQHYIDWALDSGFIQAGDRVSQHPNIAFDVSVLDTFGALCGGATLCPLLSRGDRLMPAQAIARARIDVWVSVPSLIPLMARARQLTSANLQSVKRFLFCGEPLYTAHARALFDACPDAEIWNAYGPTETTVTMTALRLTPSSLPDGPDTVALGDAIPGMAMWLEGGPHVDEGELVIAGPQVAEGYWNAPELTARAFRASTYAGHRRAYYSGDWAERVDGRIYFRSRVDHQVKIHGYRVELGEVAAAIRAAGWPDVAVILVGDRIVAVIEQSAPMLAEWGQAALRATLGRALESYAVPAAFLIMESLPRTSNDKLDLAAIQVFARTRLIAP